MAISTGGASYLVDGAIGATLPAYTAGVTGDGGNNLLVGTSGDEAGANALAGNGGSDILVGGDGNDTLDGGPGDDLVLGGNGNDRLSGGPGDDILSGGAGEDAFRINGPTEGLDHILDFNAAEGDVIELLASAFGVPPGGDARAVFGTDATPNAGSATERFHFDTANHTLYYDADGNGARRRRSHRAPRERREPDRQRYPSRRSVSGPTRRRGRDDRAAVHRSRRLRLTG